MGEYDKMMTELAKGWNTWNVRSVLSHVLLPEGFAVNLGVKEYRNGQYLKETLARRPNQDEENVRFGPRTYDGSYTELVMTWRDIELKIQSARDGDDLVILVTPLANQLKPATLIVESGILWNRPGHVDLKDGTIVASLPGRNVTVYGIGTPVDDVYVTTQTPYLSLMLDGPVGVSTGKKRSIKDIATIVETNRKARNETMRRLGDLADVYDAMQTCMAWNTVYGPSKDCIITTMSRIWYVEWGGYFDCCWDTYFAALMASVDDKHFGYANVGAITQEIKESGYVPNYSAATGCRSRDRSQPPVGSMVVRELYRMFGDKWLIDEFFDDLLTWNRWWPEHRDTNGFLCWGSDPYEPVVGNFWEMNRVHERFGGALESGLDNSPMYDDIPFDKERHQLKLADVGLMSFYVADCEALAEMADQLGRTKEAEELQQRGEKYKVNLRKLWDDTTGIFLNKRTDTGEFDRRISPTNFYPMICRAATQEQAERMMDEHFYNPGEFWGEWMLPSISRSDPTYAEQDYWRGPIWGPMNFLVYLGLRNYNLPKARKDLVEKSKALLLKEWNAKRHVHENYNADTGEGCFGSISDPFYHWGGLLGLISLMEAGHVGKQKSSQ